MKSEWAKRIQRRAASNAKLIVWLGCIVKKVETLLKSFFCKWKSTEEVKPPLDYAKPHWHKYDWEKWVQNNKDEWN